MARKQLDPAPRSYAANISLNRRGTGARIAEDAEHSADTIEHWLLHDALNARDMLVLVEQFCSRLAAAGIPVSRLAMNVGTLHPQLIGFSWIWEADDGFCDEIRVEIGTLNHPSYRRSPLYRTIEFGETIGGDPHDPELAARYPIMADLAARGFRDYLVTPITPIGGPQQHRISASLASMQVGGLSGTNGDVLGRLLRLLSMHVARLTAALISQNIAAAYLGEAAGRQVLEGSIQRGAGAPITAVVLVSDLRRSTEISELLPPEAMLALLNAYFECLTEAIEARGGEVLKFVGDGLLAVFPFDDPGDASTAAASAYAAATEALEGISRVNIAPPQQLQGIDGWQPLRTGIALHAGEVFFGNIGSQDRLDFTVIGPAVNMAARVESMTKDLQRPLLVTGPVASLLSQNLEPLGSFSLRGIADPVQLYAPRTKDAVEE